MKALVYRNTTTTLPAGQWTNVHAEQPRGYAYSTATHFLHIYGSASGLHVISTGLTVSEQRQGSLRDWVIRRFGAKNIQRSFHEVGLCVRAVWRTSLYNEDELPQALGFSEDERRMAEQALRILVTSLDDILLYIEPDARGLKAFSHKTRDLLILSCTEVENFWRSYTKLAGFRNPRQTTTTYVRLCDVLFLKDFELIFKPHNQLSIRPFKTWDLAAPTQSIAWYDACNKTKHDRSGYFSEASLLNCIYSVAANLVLFSVRFGPFGLFRGSGMLQSLTFPLFGFGLHRPKVQSFYVPSLDISHRGPDLTWGHAKVNPWSNAAFRM